MIYSYVYKRFYPIERGTDTIMLEGKERERLAKSIRMFPRHLTAWIIETMKHRKLDESKDYNFGSSLDVLRKECASLANKVESGKALTEEEIITANISLCANKYNWILSCFIISPESHLLRTYDLINTLKKEREE